MLFFYNKHSLIFPVNSDFNRSLSHPLHPLSTLPLQPISTSWNTSCPFQHPHYPLQIHRRGDSGGELFARPNWTYADQLAGLFAARTRTHHVPATRGRPIGGVGGHAVHGRPQANPTTHRRLNPGQRELVCEVVAAYCTGMSLLSLCGYILLSLVLVLLVYACPCWPLYSYVLIVQCISSLE